MRYLEEDTIGRQALRRGEVVLSLINSLNLERPRILEIGCGNGWFAEELQAIGSVHGVDLADAAIETARRRVPEASFGAGDIFSMNLPEGFFDVVVSLETLSHVMDQRRFIRISSHALRKDGYLVLATQNRRVYLRRSDIGPPGEGQIRRWLTRGELRCLLNPEFECLRLFTVEPGGDKGIGRIVNSRKLNCVLRWVFSHKTIQGIKERAGFGQTIVALAKKRS